MNKTIFILILLTVLLYGWPLLRRQPREKVEMVPQGVEQGGEVPFMKEEFISPPGHMQVHVASMAELRDGTLVVVWYGGKHEGSKDTLIYFTTRRPGEDGRWTMPRGILGRASASKELKRYIKKVGNPLIFSDSEDRLLLLYVTVSVGGWSGSSLNKKMSVDGGETWSRSRRLTLSPFLNVSELVRNNPVRLRGGGFVVPIYHECIGTFSELLWLYPGTGERSFHYNKTRLTWGKRFIQPALTVGGPGKAAVFFRSHGGEKKIAMSESDDAGESWTEPRYLELPNPGAGLNAVRLSGNRVLLSYNHHEKTREDLSLAVSDGNLGQWRRTVVLENERGEEFSYPYMIRTGDGKIHLLYTWKRKRIKHVVFNQAWLSWAAPTPSDEPPLVSSVPPGRKAYYLGRLLERFKKEKEKK
ncbi:MAG: exo-alpha-sialidase [bacterium]|nr:exo-alpha-sialidase [bacterium]